MDIEVPADVFLEAMKALMVPEPEMVGSVARAIMAERERCAEIARRAHVAHAQWSDTYNRDIAAAILTKAEQD